MNILGLDMSSQKSGYSYFNGENLFDYGVWTMSRDEEKDWRERIKWMAKQLHKYCTDNQVDYIYVEDVPPIADNNQTVKVLSALQGCVLTVADVLNIEVNFVPVAKWKKKIGIDLTHSKENNIYKKMCSKTILSSYKNSVKSIEKKLSVDNCNRLFKTELVWKSATSKYNQDDTADAINIVASEIMDDCKSDVDINEVLKEIYEKVNQPKEQKGFERKTSFVKGG